MFDSGEIDYVIGSAQCSNWTSGQCQVKFNMFQPWGAYNVLQTDYTSYTIVYSCSGILANMIKLDWMWILTREPLVPNSQEWLDMQALTYGIIE